MTNNAASVVQIDELFQKVTKYILNQLESWTGL